MVNTLSGADLIGEVSFGENRVLRSPAGPGDWRRLDSYLCQFDNIYIYIFIYIYLFIYIYVCVCVCEEYMKTAAAIEGI